MAPGAQRTVATIGPPTCEPPAASTRKDRIKASLLGQQFAALVVQQDKSKVIEKKAGRSWAGGWGWARARAGSWAWAGAGSWARAGAGSWARNWLICSERAGSCGLNVPSLLPRQLRSPT
jgi:hypothetical protein